ncbi:MAG: GAF domain-containing protein, partial [Deltaproteobacteria bacterium]|nr:GAF domain-containing protein [Deltaproteobacteria bacterium]
MARRKSSPKRRRPRAAARKPDGDLRAENERLSDELDLFRLLSDFESTGFSLERLLDRFLQRVMRVFRTSAGTVFSLDADSGELIFRAVRGKARHRLHGRRMPADTGIAGWVARTGKPRLVRDVRRDPRWWRKISDYIQYPTKDILAVPLRSSSGKQVGVIELLNRDDHAGYTEQDLEYMNRIAGSVGTLLENARLWDAAQQSNRRLEVLNEVGHLVVSSLDLRQIQQRAIQAASELVDCEAGS